MDKRNNLIKNNVVINDKKIDSQEVLKSKPFVNRPKKSFKNALRLDEINEKMPNRIDKDIKGFGLTSMSPDVSLTSDKESSSEESSVGEEDKSEH